MYIINDQSQQRSQSKQDRVVTVDFQIMCVIPKQLKRSAYYSTLDMSNANK